MTTRFNEKLATVSTILQINFPDEIIIQFVDCIEIRLLSANNGYYTCLTLRYSTLTDSIFWEKDQRIEKVFANVEIIKFINNYIKLQNL